ncbi:MAG: SGNH/GDSL hydrolase family protein [Paracoccaceae bacterium]
MSADTLLTLALSPLLLAQALHVRRNALILPEPPGPRAGTAGSGPALDLLILGDSSAAGVGAGHQNTALSGQLTDILGETHRVDWRLEARTGATSATALARLETLPARPFDAALVILGVNDVTRFVSTRRFLARRQAIHNLLRDRFGVTRIVASGLPPMGHFPLLPQPLRATLGRRAARLDTALARFCAQDGSTHLPLDLPYDPAYVAPDGFHPSETAYATWARMLAPLIAPARAGSGQS